MFLLSYTINAWPNLVFLPVGNLHWLCQFLKIMKRDLIQYHPVSLLPIINIFEFCINDSLTKHGDITGLFSDLQYGFCADFTSNITNAGVPQCFLTPESILYLYKSTIRPFMEYCSHIWGGAPRSYGLDLLDRVQKLVVSLVGSGISSDLQALSHRMDVASLSLFYKYYYGKCSSELADLVPPKHVTVRGTHFSEQMHRHAVNSPMCRTKFYQSSFFPCIAALWNTLSTECFPSDYDCTAFKVRVNKFLLLKCWPSKPFQ